MNFNNGIPTEEQQRIISSKVMNKLTGSTGQKVIVSFNSDETSKTTVDDIQLMINYITDNGGDLISEPMQSIAGFPALHSYARDPEGNVLHLAQNLKEE